MTSSHSEFTLTQALASSGIRMTASTLQWRSELEQFCRFMVENDVSSFLEIGSATGQLSVFMKDALMLNTVCACDLHPAPLLLNRSDIPFFLGDHHSLAYRRWRDERGHIDMILIDANHDDGFRLDYEIESHYPHRFIAFHDIANDLCPSLGEFWRTQVTGNKVVFLNENAEDAFGFPEIVYPHVWVSSQAELERLCGRTCGIGVVWDRDKQSR